MSRPGDFSRRITFNNVMVNVKNYCAPTCRQTSKSYPSHFFSEAVRDAFVTSKLGVSPDDGERGRTALLSFLPII